MWFQMLADHADKSKIGSRCAWFQMLHCLIGSLRVLLLFFLAFIPPPLSELLNNVVNQGFQEGCRGMGMRVGFWGGRSEREEALFGGRLHTSNVGERIRGDSFE
ncbi:hypothetical protein KSP40_PGU015665 [Platanthera guangdongensis]|uniref:Uncharacterized protein n=1 Tax=Platanthera guangdongensis TaxID=2320717 RepID=A0ABR2MN03_9ASPA